jgi:hypothetical protein
MKFFSLDAHADLGVGAIMNMFEVSTLGQPLEVVKTQMASNRSVLAIRRVLLEANPVTDSKPWHKHSIRSGAEERSLAVSHVGLKEGART